MAFNGKYVLNLALFAQNQGVSKDLVLDEIGLSDDDLCSESCIIENDSYNLVVGKAVKLTGDECFGMHAGEHLSLSAAGLIGQITQNSETIHQAIQYCCDFANLGCSVLPMGIERTERTYKVVIQPDMEWASKSEIALKQTVYGVLAFNIRELKSLAPNANLVMNVDLPWEHPNNLDEYHRVLGPVNFNQKEIAIHLDVGLVNQRIINADYELLRILVNHAERKSAEFQTEKNFVNIVRQSVVKLIKPEFPSIQEVASHLNMSTRSLQRSLKQDGVSFQKLVNQIRLEMAKDYLKDENLTVKDISYLLGYSEPSVFVKAFKSWTGFTPGAFSSK